MTRKGIRNRPGGLKPPVPHPDHDTMFCRCGHPAVLHDPGCGECACNKVRPDHATYPLGVTVVTS